MVVSEGLPESVNAECARVAAGHCLCGEVAQTGRYMAARRCLHTAAARLPQSQPHGHRVAPICDGEELLGVLNCYADPDRLPHRNDESFLTAACHVLAGIIRRHQAQDALRRAEDDLRGLIEHAPEGIALHRDGIFVLANELVCRALGYTRDELVGAPMMQIIAAEERPAVVERVRTMMETGEPVPPKVERMIRKDGSEIHVEVTAVQVIFEGPPCVLAMARDVDERERLTAKALEADRLIALGTLAAGVGHEINNPLTYVSANVAFVLESIEEAALEGGSLADAQDIVEALSEAREGTERIAAIVRDLRAMTRSLGAQVSIPVADLLDRATRLLAKQVQQRARLEVEHGATKAVNGDPGRLGQVLLNLLTNAAHACVGDPQQHLVSMRSWDDGDEVCIEVSDDGQGIPREILERIYDPFFTTKPVGEGTGLGLSICRRIVEEHQGRMTVASETDEGTCVTLHLPAFVP